MFEKVGSPAATRTVCQETSQEFTHSNAAKLEFEMTPTAGSQLNSNVSDRKHHMTKAQRLAFNAYTKR